MKKITYLIVASFLIGCGGAGGGGGGGASSNEGADRVLALVVISDGNNQTATVGTELPTALMAILYNHAGLPISGLVVNFKVVTGGGSVFAGSAISDSNGIVRERWTLGTVAGPQKVEVRAVDSTGAAVVFATFDATAVADAPTSVTIASGNSQSAIQLQPLGLPVKVIVKDAYGNPVAGVVVAFTANNGGTAFPGTAVTNAAGEAAASWTLGLAIGDQTLDAVVTGLPAARFNATATKAPPSAATAITKFSGDLQTIVQHSILPQPLQVLVTDNLGNGVPGIQVVFSAAGGSGYILPTTVTTDYAGKASWKGYLHTAGQQEINASVSGLPPTTFIINVSASNHPYDGYYPNCYDMDIINGVPSNSRIHQGMTGSMSSGTLNESNGYITFVIYSTRPRYYNHSGYLVIDSLQRVTGSGTWYETITGEVGTWTCERQ